MEQCLIDNKVCTIQNRKCKDCKLDDCKNTIKILETMEEKEERRKKELIYKQLPEQCRGCSFLMILDLDKQKLKCSYLIKNKCLLE